MTVAETGPGGHLLTAWNLADLNSVPTALLNLGLVDANGVLVGGLMAQFNGPGGSTDYSTPATVFTVMVPMINGQSYEIALKAEGQQVTAASAPSQVYVGDSMGLIPTTFLKGVMANLAIGAFLGGGATEVITATSTGNNTFTVTASATAGAYRVAANAIAFSVKRVG